MGAELYRLQRLEEGIARCLRSVQLLAKARYQIINSLAKGRPADAALLAAGYRPPFNLPDTATATELSAAANLGNDRPNLLPDSGESALLQAHKAAFFFKLERELEKVSYSSVLVL